MADSVAPADRHAPEGAVSTHCHACRVAAAVGRGQVETADGRRCQVTYADADIVVWDCPACSYPNAEDLTEG